jgi:glucose-6-phosphate isomerase
MASSDESRYTYVDMPKHPMIAYDHANMRRGALSASLLKRLRGVHADMKRLHKEGAYGFTTIPDRDTELLEVRRVAASLRKEFRTLIVVGIGGSDLGARALVAALQDGVTAKDAMDIRFAGANTDPDELAALLKDVDLRKCAINVISKSGDTVEPMSAFLILRQKLIAKVGRKRHARHIVATTDAYAGTLREIADRENYRALPVPQEIGGRFSALTSVGLLACECAGIDGRALLYGAGETLRAFLASAPKDNGPLLFAGLQMDAYRRGHNVAVLMPYASRLREFGGWFRQLWGESLGKKLDRTGRVVRVGQTPVAALGATDQHSQLQLWNEGPSDTTVTFVDHGSFDTDMIVPDAFPDLAPTALMGGKSLARINRAEREATAAALSGYGTPNGTVRMRDISAASLGALMMFFMLATAAAGELLRIDAFDQPGVESMKRELRRLLAVKR